jgi:hypothetical protein
MTLSISISFITKQLILLETREPRTNQINPLTSVFTDIQNEIVAEYNHTLFLLMVFDGFVILLEL